LNLESEILKEHSKRQTLKIARWVGGDGKRFAELMGLFLRGEYRVTQRSAWIVSQCAEAHPKLIGPWLRPMLKKMRSLGVHDAVRRNVVRILQFVEIPRALMGEIAADCFGFLNDVHTPVAVKAFSMTVLARIAQREPSLKQELELVIRRMLPYGGAAIQARGRHVLKTLKRI
jgi:hypothetical protein